MVIGGDECVNKSDQWALEYIGINYVRSTLEAFDDDASGFVTVKEANNFTRSRPLDWRWVVNCSRKFETFSCGSSLSHWLAYWAIGDCLSSVDQRNPELTMRRLADNFHGLLRKD